MKTLINIKTDQKLKNQARLTAKRLGLPLGTIINNYLRRLVAEKQVIFSLPLTPNKQTGDLLRRASRDYRLGKNIAGPFRTAKEIDDYLTSAV